MDQSCHAPNRCGIVTIAGRPNVGKSTLLNRLLGQKLAITSHKAQTTRHALLGINTRPDGQIIFIDTPGLHQRGDEALNRYLNRTACAALSGIDLVLFMVAAPHWTSDDALALQTIATAATCPVVAAINKIDRCRDKGQLLPYLNTLASQHPFVSIIPVSARTGEQMTALEDCLLAQLPEGANQFPDDQITDRSERFFAAELLREQLIQRYGAELPYHTTVVIEQFIQHERYYHIQALILVERDSQKGIIIGHRGSALKAAASQARQEMQKAFGCPVHLKTWVKVKKGWSRHEPILTTLGY
jgi:GTP-binding protein Era